MNPPRTNARPLCERHILNVNGDFPDVEVALWADGSVDVTIGSETLSVEALTEIVAFVEAHAQVEIGERP